MIILEGEVYQQIEGNDYQYSTGTCCLIDRNTKHREKFSGEAKLLFIGLSADFIRQLLIEQTGYYFKNECLADNSIFRFIMDNISSEEQKNYLDIFPSFQNQNSIVRLHSLSDKLLHLMMSPSLGATYGIKSIVCELFEYLNDETLFHITPVKLKTKSDFLLFSRISHLLEDTDGDLSRSELADLLNYSGNYLNSIVKKYTGMCLYDYSLTFRLKKAAYLLTTTTDSISSMALKLNFSNKTHFYNLFKKKYGMSPGEYRKLSAFSDI